MKFAEWLSEVKASYISKDQRQYDFSCHDPFN